MPTVEVTHLAKAFGPTQAVVDVSFAVEKGEIFGLLGPNGAGKTTSIRLMLDIFKPDQGTVSILGGPMNEAKKDRIGYMPEERGLYQEMPLEQCLVYLGTLKGLSKSEARRRVKPYLERFDLANVRGKKVKELSKGMQQKAQIISTVLHDPESVDHGRALQRAGPGQHAAGQGAAGGTAGVAARLFSCPPTSCTRLRNYATASC